MQVLGPSRHADDAQADSRAARPATLHMVCGKIGLRSASSACVRAMRRGIIPFRPAMSSST